MGKNPFNSTVHTVIVRDQRVIVLYFISLEFKNDLKLFALLQTTRPDRLLVNKRVTLHSGWIAFVDTSHVNCLYELVGSIYCHYVGYI